MCVGVSVWLGWSGIRVAVVLQPATHKKLFAACKQNASKYITESINTLQTNRRKELAKKYTDTTRRLKLGQQVAQLHVG